MSFWDTNGVSGANLERLGPWFDVVVGTEGRYTDLNAAVAAGHTRIIITEGAVLTADLLLSGKSNGFIWGPHAPEAINLGAYQIDAQNCSHFHFGGFRVQAVASKSGIVISGTSNGLVFSRVASNGHTGGGHGFEFTTSGHNNVLDGGEAIACAGDGVEISGTGDHQRITGGQYRSNTGYGIDSQGSALTVAIGARITGNGAGSTTGSFSLNSNATT